MDNYYEILGVWRDASANEIEHRYRSLRDRLEDEQEFDEAAATRLRAVEEARAVLIDPTQRAAYDQLLKSPGSGGGTSVDPSEIDSPAHEGPLDGLPEKARKHLELHEGEEVLAVINGAGSQAIVATQTRLIIVKPGMLAGATFGARLTSFDYRNITAIELNKMWATAVIEVIAPGYQGVQGTRWGGKDGENAFQTSNCLPLAREQAEMVGPTLALIRRRIAETHSPSVAATPTSGVADELAKLVELREQGVLSEEEFDSVKQRLLAS